MEKIMRCICCDVALSDYESTLKSSVTSQYLDMCLKCLSFTKEGALYTDNKTHETEDGTVLANNIYNIDYVEDGLYPLDNNK